MSRSLILIATALSAIALSVGCGTTQHEFTPDMAEAFLAAYTAAVERGDSAAVYQSWSTRSRDRQGFWRMHFSIGRSLPFSEYIAMLQHYTFRIREVVPNADYFTIELDLVFKDTFKDTAKNAEYAMRYYVVYENDKPALINPVDVITRDWQTYETDHFIFHFPKEIDPTEHQFEMHEMERQSAEAAGFLDIEMPDRVDFYRAIDGAQCGELVLCPPSNGRAGLAWNLISSTTFVNPHEFIHLITMPNLPYLTAAFCEGLPVALAGGAWFTADFSMHQAGNLLDDDRYIPIAEVLTSQDADFLSVGDITYHEAGAFVKFLLDEYGWGKLKELHHSVRSPDELEAVFASLYGGTIGSLEDTWFEYLRALELPRIGCSIPTNAELVFATPDPEGDDTGDGDYSYPTDERFRAGMFDLTGFEIRQDSANVYFRVRLRDIGGVVFDSTTGHTYTAGAVIAIKRGDTFGNSLQRRCQGVEFQNGGFDIRLDIGRGLTATDNYGRAYFASGDTREKITNREHNCLEFSLPIDFIGRPDRDWEYFAGTCLMNDVGLSFLRSIPWHIHPEAGQFHFGGGRSMRLSPRFIDILVPEGKHQADLLSDYDPDRGRPAGVPMIAAP